LTRTGDPASLRKISGNEIYYDQYGFPSEKVVKASNFDQISSIRNTPAGGSLNDLGVNYASKYGVDAYTTLPPYGTTGTQPYQYGGSGLNKYSNYDPYPISDKWANQSPNVYNTSNYNLGYNPSTKTPPKSRADLEEGKPDIKNDNYPSNEKNYKIEFDFAKNYDMPNENTQNQEILNSADRKMKRLTLKAKPTEEKDLESNLFAWIINFN